jgi:protease I
MDMDLVLILECFMNKKVLIPLPTKHFDPSEVAIPWKYLNQAGIEIVFATPSGIVGETDLRMLHGTGLGILKPILAADKNAINTFEEMEKSTSYQNPIAWKQIKDHSLDALFLPGGHDKGVREYLESELLQKYVVECFSANKPVAAVCHGVVLVARSKKDDGKSVLHGRKTTSLLASQERTAYYLTCLWLGDYYLTYKESVESEVTKELANSKDFLAGPFPILRDDESHLDRGFIVEDGNYLSGRWPGDIHRLSKRFTELVIS